MPPKDGEVFVKIHAVSLQYRDLAIALGTYPIAYATSFRLQVFATAVLTIAAFILYANKPYFLRSTPNVIPGSDCAGEVLAVGTSVRDFEPGDRVCANFNPEHVYGELRNAEHAATGLGAQVDGVLTEYRNFPSYVNFSVYNLVNVIWV